MSPHAIWSATLIVVVTVAGSVALVMAGKPVEALLAIIGLVVVPTTTALMVHVVVKPMAQNVVQIRDNVNGHLTDLTSKIPNQGPGEGETSTP